MQCCIDQHSISTKLHASLYMMMVSMEVMRSEHTDFQISKPSGDSDAPYICLLETYITTMNIKFWL
jgi:hypothetical protein